MLQILYKSFMCKMTHTQKLGAFTGLRATLSREKDQWAHHEDLSEGKPVNGQQVPCTMTPAHRSKQDEEQEETRPHAEWPIIPALARKDLEARIQRGTKEVDDVVIEQENVCTENNHTLSHSQLLTLLETQSLCLVRIEHVGHVCVTLVSCLSS